MLSDRENSILCVDIGDLYIRAMVCPVDNSEVAVCLGAAIEPASGIRKGVVVDGVDAAMSLRSAAAMAVRSCGSSVRELFIALPDDSSFTGRQTVGIVREAGFGLFHPVPRHLALSSAVLGKLDMECGVVLIDINSGSAGVYVYFENKLAYSRHLAITDPHLIAGETVAMKLADVFLSVRHHVYKSGLDGLLSAGAVITGGLANSPGSVSLAKNILEMPARRGRPRSLRGLPANWRSPAFAGIVGLALSNTASNKLH